MQEHWSLFCSQNFNMSLKDDRLLDALKVEVQIDIVEKDPKSIGSILHYQMAYWFQDHALDLALPTSSNALLFLMDSDKRHNSPN